MKRPQLDPLLVVVRMKAPQGYGRLLNPWPAGQTLEVEKIRASPSANSGQDDMVTRHPLV